MRLIPRPLHGILDYTIGILLLFSPWLFGFLHHEPLASDLAKIFGAGILVYTSLTNFEVGIVRLIPFPAHLILDFFTGAALAGSPILFSVGGKAAIVFVVIGVLELAVASSTRTPGTPRGNFPSWT